MGLFISGCHLLASQDHFTIENSLHASNYLIINGRQHVLQAGRLQIKGTRDYPHYLVSLTLVDGEMQPQAFRGGASRVLTPVPGRTRMRIDCDLFGVRASEFRTGVFHFLNDFKEAPKPEEAYFDDFFIAIDGNGDGDTHDFSQDHRSYAVSGQIEIEGRYPNYIVHFDILLANGQRFRSTYQGGFRAE